jgi:hypothetical protein
MIGGHIPMTLPDDAAGNSGSKRESILLVNMPNGRAEAASGAC